MRKEVYVRRSMTTCGTHLFLSSCTREHISTHGRNPLLQRLLWLTRSLHQPQDNTKKSLSGVFFSLSLLLG